MSASFAARRAEDGGCGRCCVRQGLASHSRGCGAPCSLLAGTTIMRAADPVCSRSISARRAPGWRAAARDLGWAPAPPALRGRGARREGAAADCHTGEVPAGATARQDPVLRRVPPPRLSRARTLDHRRRRRDLWLRVLAVAAARGSGGVRARWVVGRKRGHFLAARVARAARAARAAADIARRGRRRAHRLPRPRRVPARDAVWPPLITRGQQPGWTDGAAGRRLPAAVAAAAPRARRPCPHMHAYRRRHARPPSARRPGARRPAPALEGVATCLQRTAV